MPEPSGTFFAVIHPFAMHGEGNIEARYERAVKERGRMIDALGGEAGCKTLSAAFCARVAGNPELRPLFPGKSLRCVTEEFSAFLVLFLGGDEQTTKFRWWLSLRESHARFRIVESQRTAWLKQMEATLRPSQFDKETLRQHRA